MTSSVITPLESPERKLNLPLPVQKRPKIILLKIRLTNRFGFKTSFFPCKSQLRYCYLNFRKWLPFLN